MFETESQSYYETLDVKPDASQSEIRQAYLRTKAAYSKDSAALYSIFDEHETRKVLESIEQAYLVLSNPEKRKEYDKVHGFIGGEDRFPNASKNTSSRSFSFARPTSERMDAPEQSARAAFGSTNEPRDADDSSPPPAASRAAAGHDEYSTPRTLASHDAAGPPVEEYTSRPFSTSENRLGIVRRIDLSKPYERSSDMEGQISAESDFRGEFFKKVREYKSISVDELADFTKISRTYINCIESEDFKNLPAPAYLRGFVSQIAKALKLPHEKAASAYMDHYKKTALK